MLSPCNARATILQATKPLAEIIPGRSPNCCCESGERPGIDRSSEPRAGLDQLTESSRIADRIQTQKRLTCLTMRLTLVLVSLFLLQQQQVPPTGTSVVERTITRAGSALPIQDAQVGIGGEKASLHRPR